MFLKICFMGRFYFPENHETKESSRSHLLQSCPSHCSSGKPGGITEDGIFEVN
jgi:hypothetical protein